MSDFLALVCRLERHQAGDKLRYPLGFFGRQDALFLLWPTLIDHVTGIIAQLILQSATHRLRIGAEITIQCLKARGFVGDDVIHGGKILISGNREKPDQNPVEHGKNGESDTYHLIGTPIPVDPRTEKTTKEKN